MLFTTKTKIPNFNLLKLNEVEIILHHKSMYLGIIQDTKLISKINIAERVKKAYISTPLANVCWIQRCIYAAIVRPTLLYSSLEWWPAFSKKNNCLNLSRVQESACIGATGALRTTPTYAMNVLLHLHPPDTILTTWKKRRGTEWTSPTEMVALCQHNETVCKLIWWLLFKTWTRDRKEWNRSKII